MTIPLASPLGRLVHCVVKHSGTPDLKSSSNVSLPFAWITGPATDPSLWAYGMCLNVEYEKYLEGEGGEGEVWSVLFDEVYTDLSKKDSSTLRIETLMSGPWRG